MRYCRLAPIADVARDYRVASSANKTQDELKTSTKLNVKLTKLVEGHLKTYEDDAKTLYDLIRQVERQCAPREFVINNKTGEVHKVLTHMHDVGGAAICYCSFKYARASVTLKTELRW